MSDDWWLNEGKRVDGLTPDGLAPDQIRHATDDGENHENYQQSFHNPAIPPIQGEST